MNSFARDADILWKHSQTILSRDSTFYRPIAALEASSSHNNFESQCLCGHFVIPQIYCTPDRCTTRLPCVTFSRCSLADLEFMFTIVVGQSRKIYGIEKSRSLIYSTTGRYSKESTHADYKVYGPDITLLLLRYETLPVSQG